MCLVAIAYQQHPDYPLLILANRDEFHQRPSQASQPWSEAPHLLGGRDLRDGGAWMLQRDDGHFALVTNIRAPGANTGERSRGELPLRALQTGQSLYDNLQHIHADRHHYRGFNLLAGNRHQLYFSSSHLPQIQALPPAIHLLSNASLNTPWPKTEQLRRQLSQQLHGHEWSSDSLLDLLHEQRVDDTWPLPDTGVGETVERLLAPIFICSENYGTRSSTLLLQHRSGAWQWRERRFDAHGTLQEHSEWQGTITLPKDAADG